MSQLIHALGMKLRESVSSKVVYKAILVAHLEAIVLPGIKRGLRFRYKTKYNKTRSVLAQIL